MRGARRAKQNALCRRIDDTTLAFVKSTILCYQIAKAKTVVGKNFTEVSEPIESITSKCPSQKFSKSQALLSHMVWVKYK